MKKFILLISLLLTSLQINAQDYCTDGGPSSTFDSNVESVDLVGETTTIAYLGCQNVGNGVAGVEDQTGSQTADVVAGNSYTADVQFGSCGTNFAGVGEAWIDFDRDGVFEPGESLGTISGTPPFALQSFAVTVPNDAVNGSSRMRVIQWEDGSLPLDPCASFTWGSVVDFEIVISGGIDITCEQPFNVQLVGAFGSSADFSWDLAPNDQNGYIWEVFNAGDDPDVDTPVSTGTVGSGVSTVNADGLTELTDYDFYVTTDCGATDGLSSRSNGVAFTTVFLCPAPTNVAVDGVVADAFNISWNEIPNAASGYTWSVFSSGDNPAVDTPLFTGTEPFGTTTTTVTGLTDNTTYDVYVSADCDTDGTSELSNVVTVTTPCLAILAPVTENFDGADWVSGTGFGNTGDAIDDCWQRAPESPSFFWGTRTGTTGSGGTGPSGANSGANYVFTESSNGVAGAEAFLTSPLIDLSTLTDPALTFWYHLFGADMGTLSVDIDAGSGFDLDVFTISGQQQTAEADPFIEQIIDLNAYAGQTVRIRFRGIRGAQFTSDMAIDDFKVDEAPSCFTPTGLSVANITQDAADLSWDDNSTASNGFNWFVFNAGDDPLVDTPVATGSTGFGVTTANVTGLPSSSALVAYVQTDCGAVDGLSDLSSPVSFDTLCDVFPTPYFEDFQNFEVTTAFVEDGCWTENSPDAFAWDVSTNGTPSASTGPSGAQFGDNYIFSEGSSGVAGNEAIILSPLVDLSSLTDPSLSFWYHMYGADIDVLHIDVIDEAANLDLSVFSITGQQQTDNDEPWLEEIVDLSAYAGQTIQVRFRAVRGSSFDADVAIDGVRFDEIPVCFPASNIAVSNITETTADFSWDDEATATDGYNWFVFEAGDDPEADTPLATGSVGGGVTTVNVTGLPSSSALQFYLESDCGTNGLSVLSPALNFDTLCDIFPTPYFEDFANFTVSTAFNVDFVEDGCWEDVSPGAFAWDVATGATGSAGTGPDGAQFGANYLFSESSSGVLGDEAIVLTPEVDLTNLTDPSLSFWYHMFGADTGTLHVDVDDGTTLDLSVFSISGQQQTAEADPWVEVTVDLAAYAGQTIEVRFRAVRGNGFTSDIAIDGVRFDEIPSCLPVNNITASNVGDTTVDLSWNGNSTAVTYNWEVFLEGDDPAADTPVLSGTEANTSFTLTGLTASTSYDFYVTTDCGVDGESLPTGPFNFGTAGCPASSQCDHTFILNDTFGDGWNGNTMDVIQDGIVVATLGTSFTTGNTFTEVIPLCDGSTFELFWNDGGAFLGEVGIEVIDPFDDQLYELIASGANTNNTSLFTSVVSCTPPPCPKPTNLSVTNLFDSSVTLNWDDNGNAVNGYTWSIFALGSDPEVDSPLFSGSTPDGVTTVDVTGLTESFDYEFYVVADCGATDGLSDISQAFPFSTPCAIFSAPYSNDFEAFPVTTTLELEDCWTEDSPGTFGWDVGTGATGSFNTGPSGALSGNNYVFTEASSGALGDEAILLSPLVDLTPLSQPALSFWYHMYGGDIGTLAVDVKTSSAGSFDLDVFTLSGEQQTAEDDAWIEQFVDLSAYAGSIIQFRFRVVRGNGFAGDVAIEDVLIDEAPSCLTPTGLAVSNITETTADLNWSPVGNATAGYDWFVFNAGDDPAVDTPIASGSTGAGVTSANVTGLPSSSFFEAYVQANCGAADGLSELSPAVGFETLCDVFPTPYFEDFENFTVSTGFGVDFNEDGCWEDASPGAFSWDVGTGATGSFDTGPDAAFSGANYLFSEASSGVQGDEAIVLSPDVDLSNLTTPALSFRYHMYGADIDQLSVDVDNGTTLDLDVFTIVGEQQTSEADDWVQTFVDLTAYAGQTVQVRFRVTRGNGFAGDVAIDDVNFDEAPTCFDPLNLEVLSVTDTTADLNWQAGSSETNFDVEVVLAGTAPTGTPTFEDVSVPFTATGLTSETDYDFYVRADCGAGDVSNWVGPESFTTALTPVTVVVNAPAINNTYCYGNNEFKEWLFVASDGTTAVEVDFNTGTIEDGTGSTDRLRVFDGFDDTATVLYDSNVDGTDMAGVSLTANSGAMYMLLQSDIFGSCQGGVDDEDPFDFDVFAGVMSTVAFSSDNFSYYPNPVKSMLQIDSANPIESVQVFDILGKKVFDQDFDRQDISIDFSDLSSGTYLMKVDISGNSQTFRVIKE